MIIFKNVAITKKVRKNKAVTPDSSPYKQLSFGLENENQ